MTLKNKHFIFSYILLGLLGSLMPLFIDNILHRRILQGILFFLLLLGVFLGIWFKKNRNEKVNYLNVLLIAALGLLFYFLLKR